MTATGMRISVRYAVHSSGLARRRKTPKFHSAIEDAKYAKTRLRRLPGFRTSASAARGPLRDNATSGKRLCGLTAVPLGWFERKVDLVLLALGLDLVPQDAEDDKVPVALAVEPGLAQDTFLSESVAAQGVYAQGVVLLPLCLDTP